MSNEDLNEIITRGISAKIDSAVAQALAGDEGFTHLVTAALQQPVEVPDGSGGYGKKRVPFLNHVLQQSVRERTKKVVAETIQELEPEIRKHVKEAVKESVGVIAESLVDGFLADAAGRHPSIKVEFQS